LNKARRKKILRTVESGFLTVGVLMLVVYFLARGWGGYQSRSDIRVFEQAVASESISATPAVASGESAAAEPDYSLWSAKRINEYHASHSMRSDAPLAVLSIGKFGLKVPVYNGTDEINLNRGAGRIKGTARIDASGNLGIAAHRDGFFRVLKDIELGDGIELLTQQGKKVFEVSSITIVDPADVSVLAPTEDPSITLVTCYPFYFVGDAPKRFIVKGELVSDQVNKS
jgi:sortase A